jgi:flagellar protein FlgJ
MVAESQVASFTDFGALTRLKSRAGQNDPQAVREAARQFEALFLQMMLKSMRDAGSAFAESRDRTYEEMFDQQIALELAQRDSLGIGDLLVRQVDALRAADDPGARSGVVESQAAVPAVAGLSTRRRSDFRPADPKDFVAGIWDLAKRTGAALGVDPRALVAQAALETGWGDHQIRDQRGVSGNNLFGVKADASWRGERIGVSTLEYEGVRFVPRFEHFRAYPSIAEGFAGYEEFLANNPRYTQALKNGSDPSTYAHELQAAGYATDPDYAAKIERILESSEFSALIDAAGRR